MWTIAVREWRAYFHTTIGWLVLTGFLLLTGFFWGPMALAVYMEQSTDLLANPYSESLMTITDHLLGPFFGNLGLILALMAPALSMRMIAEDLRNRTMELLLTSPVSTMDIVLGKYLGTMGFVGVVLLGTFYVPLSLWHWAKPDYAAIFGGYLALMLITGLVIAMGMLYSSLTSNVIVAFVLTFASALLLWLVGLVDDRMDSIPTHLSMTTHLDDLVRGAIQLSDISYYLLFIGFFLFATWQRVESMRWR